jgi:hypothetical protein
MQTVLSGIARTGSRFSRDPRGEVAFDIYHAVDRPRFLLELLQGSVADQRTYRQTLSSSAHGAGLVVITRRDSGVSVRLPDPGIMGNQGEVSGTDGGLRYTGRATPDPSFLYDAAGSFDGVISIDRETVGPMLYHAASLGDASRFVAGLARRRGAPLVLLHSPVQWVRHVSYARSKEQPEEYWARSQANAVRFSIALKHSDARVRLALLEEISTYSATRGFGFAVGDYRPSFPPGSWFTIVPSNLGVFREHLRQRYPLAARRPFSHVLPLTIFGAARVGSTEAALHVVASHRDCHPIAVAVASLDDLAFIHLLVAIPDTLDAWHEEDIARRLPLTGRAEEVLNAALGAAGFERLRVPSPDYVSRLLDYQAMAGPLVRASSTTDLDATSRPIWISFESDAECGLLPPLLSLDVAQTALFGQLVPGADACTDGRAVAPAVSNIDYLLCRDMGSGILRARGKLSVPEEIWSVVLGGEAVGAAGRMLATALENGWIAQARAVEGVRDVAVAWREQRLRRLS